MRTILKLVPVLLMSLLTGCAGITNSTSFREMSSAYRDVLEQYANDNVLLNIIRASKSMPVSFLDMPSVTGSGSVSSSLLAGPSIYGVAPGSSLAGFFTPGSGSGVTASASLSVNNGFNFTQSSLDNANFMVSFLSDLKPSAVASLGNSLIVTRDVLYSLIIESVEAQDLQGKTLVNVVNDPYGSDYMSFRTVLITLLRAGISVEQVNTMLPISAPMDAETLNRNLAGVAMAAASPTTIVIPKKLADGREGFQLVKMMPPDARICLQREAADQALPFRVSQAAYCKSAKIAVNEADRNKPEVALIIKLRSVRNIFEYLGAVVNLQNAPEPKMVTVVNSGRIGPTFNLDQALAEARPLFVVKKGPVSGAALTSVNYQGSVYSVPRDEGDTSYTHQVLMLLSQMLTLTKVPGSIPVSPSVLIR